LLIPFLGFTTEGLRLVAVSPPWANWSPVGSLVARFMLATGMPVETAGNAHAVLFWLHVGAGVFFGASIPFTKLRHLVTGPLNIVLRPLGKPGALTPVEDLETAEILGVGKVADFTSQQLLSFDACVSCGRCEELCPAACSGMPYSPRDFIQALRENMVASLITSNGGGASPALADNLREEYAWYCTTCGACMMNCPMYINPIAEVIDVRRHDALMTGQVPNSVGLVLRNIERQNNPWALPAADRAAWAEGLDVRVLQPGEETDVLFFVGCAFSFDDRSKQAGKAFVRLLQAADVDFAILGTAETCCGETARRAGHEYLFQVSAEQNIQTLDAVKFKRIVTQCTHCFNTLKNEYPQFDGDYEVQHYTELLAEIASDLPANVQQTLGTVTYQDPCYLGRYNDVYDQPRELLDKVGASRVEMAKRRESSFCCGGGGAQMWMETDPETRISNNRLAQALDADADVVATACPYCLLMLDDAIRTQGQGERIQVMDVAEVLAGQLEG
jgi:Fe-S oxidoreductase